MYEGEDYDVAGLCVGVVEKTDIVDGTKVADGGAPHCGRFQRSTFKRLLSNT